MSDATIEGVTISWDRIRDLFVLDPDLAYLNHGGFGAVPIPVLGAQQRLRHEMEANPTRFFTRGLNERLGHVRRLIAAFLGADPDGTALVPNATAGTEVALRCLRIQAGDEILLTDHGYGTVLLAVRRLATRTGAAVREVAIPLAATEEEVVASVVAGIGSHTAVAIVDHVTSPTARVMPVGRVASALRERGVPLLIDGAHAPGMLPVDVRAIGADFWVGNLHKWAFAPRPTAVLVVAPEYRRAIEPLVVSWQHPNGFPEAVEFGGTLDYTAWLAAPTGIDVLRTLGLDRVRRHNTDLAEYAVRTLAAAVRADPAELIPAEPIPAELIPAEPIPAELIPAELIPAEPIPAEPIPADGSSMRLVPLPPGVADDLTSAAALRDRLSAQHGCEVHVSPWRGRGFLRISTQVYNSRTDVDRLASACGRILDGYH